MRRAGWIMLVVAVAGVGLGALPARGQAQGQGRAGGTAWEPVPPKIWRMLGLPTFSRGGASAFQAELRVPADGLEALGLRWAQDPSPDYRERAPAALNRFRSAHTERLVRDLMRDPYYTLRLAGRWEPDPDRRVWRVHPVRSEAYRQLWAWGIWEKKDPSFEAHVGYVPLPWGRWGIGGVFVLGMVCLAARSARLRRTPRAERLKGAAAVVMTLALGVCVAGHRRSYGKYDTFSFAWRGQDWEVTSACGRVHVLRVSDESPSRGVRRWVTPWAQIGPRDGPWYAAMLAPERAVIDGEWFYWGHGNAVGALKFYPYWLVRAPYWAVWGVVGLWPAWWWGTRVLRRVRRWTRMRSGRCLECGYDLRGSMGGRCSECGAVPGLVVVRRGEAEVWV